VSETVLRLLLSELTTVRVLCRQKTKDGQDCGGVVEVPLGQLIRLGACPICQNDLRHTGNDQFYRALANGIAGLSKDQAAAIEFVIPAKP